MEGGSGARRRGRRPVGDFNKQHEEVVMGEIWIDASTCRGPKRRSP